MTIDLDDKYDLPAKHYWETREYENYQYACQVVDRANELADFLREAAREIDETDYKLIAEDLEVGIRDYLAPARDIRKSRLEDAWGERIE